MADAALAALSIVASRSTPREAEMASAVVEHHLIITSDLGSRPIISRHIFGLFVEHLGRCVYDGLVDAESGRAREDVIAALRELACPNLRWPGGCFADAYHWRDGVGPTAARPRRINQHWGGVIEDNRFGSAEFLELCAAVGCEPYVVGNVGSGTVQEMRDWLEYLTQPDGTTLSIERQAHNAGRTEPWVVRFWGVGNESWGCGGDMDVREYAAHYRRFASFLAPPAGAPPICRIACGANGRDLSWTDGMMTLCKRGGSGCGAKGGAARFAMEALSLHLYCSVRAEGLTGHSDEGAAGQAAWFRLMEKARAFGETLAAHVAVMDRHDPERKVSLAIDEWGVWYAGCGGSSHEPTTGCQRTDAASEPAAATASEVRPGGARAPPLLEQPCTLRDALVAALCLHHMIGACERVFLANLAQAVNVLHAPLTTSAADGALMRTPTFHALAMLAVHQGATRLHTQLTRTSPYNHGAAAVPRISAVASTAADGERHYVSLVHTHPHAGTTMAIELRGFGRASASSMRIESARVLTARTMGSADCAPAQLPPHAARLTEQAVLRVELPPKSLVLVTLCKSASALPVV